MTKKKKTSVEQDEPEYKLGISVKVEGEDSSDEDGIDQYGLESDDEFYQLSFIQSSPDGALDVKPATYALMTWWKVRMGNKDTIDISSDSNDSMLRFDSTYTGGEFKGVGLGKKIRLKLITSSKLMNLLCLLPFTLILPKLFRMI